MTDLKTIYSMHDSDPVTYSDGVTSLKIPRENAISLAKQLLINEYGSRAEAAADLAQEPMEEMTKG